LLDGLDEVQETDHDRLLKAIKDFTGQYRDCPCVMTCRIAAREYTFQHFTEVEVADFNEEQITEFATKWFRAKQDSKKSEDLYSAAQSQQTDSGIGNESATVNAAVPGVWRSGRLSGQSLRAVQRRAGCTAEKVGRQAQH
jgi:predicted NACHT family NTPase